MHTLNEEQKKAVNTLDGPLLIIAGAGSGKTRVVTYRIANLIDQGIPPHQILGLTFTNKAAQEMKERVQNLTQSLVWIGTFHSLGVRILRASIREILPKYTSHFTIYDEEDSLKVLKHCLQALEIKGKGLEPKVFKSLISKAKNRLESPDDVYTPRWTDLAEKFFPEVYAQYQATLEKNIAVDFDDLLYLTAKLFRDNPDVLSKYQNLWSHLLIDEYQDTNQAQYRIVQALVAKSQNVCVVGDPDQSIYSWRGANIENILRFEEDYPQATVIRLEQNFRSRTSILNTANSLINCNQNRFEKNLWSDLGVGQRVRLFIGDTEGDEANFVAQTVREYALQKNLPLSHMVIFYRTNAQSRPFEDSFLAYNIPYVIVGGISFYQRREIKDILSFLRLLISPSDSISFARTVNLPKRGIGQKTIEKIRHFADTHDISILKAAKEAPLPPRTKAKLDTYLTTLAELKQISKNCSLKELVIQTIEQTEYLSVLTSDRETYEDRKQNLDELIAKATEWENTAKDPSLRTFLEELSLKSQLDEAVLSHDRVNLMTLHNGKGLEFPLVFLVGLEEDLLPHINAKGDMSAIEEERRLCYVGMTRAKEFLYLTHCRFRYIWGMQRLQKASRFLSDIAKTWLEKVR